MPSTARQCFCCFVEQNFTVAINTINFDKLEIKKEDRVLDMGCGLGRHSLVAYRDYPVQIIAVDLSFDDLTRARKRLNDFEKKQDGRCLMFTQANGYQLPFSDASFDKVLCSEVLEHVPDYQALLAELIRVLKPGGKLALSVPKYLPEKLCWLFCKKYPEFAGHVRIFSGNELPASVENFGMLLQEKHSAHAIHSPYWFLRSLFFEQGEDFLPVKTYKQFMDWQLFKGPGWINSVEDIFNPLIGKSNVYYFDKLN